MRYSVIKPVIKDKSPPALVDESLNLSKEKSPVEHVKPSVIKSKTHSKDKLSTTILPPILLTSSKEEIKSTPEIKLPKIKKSSLDNIDILSSSTSNTPAITSPGSNSIPLKNKYKVKIIKKPKKIETQKHPAFYFVSI